MQYIELKIKDQSVYWGEDLLLKEAELQHMQGTCDLKLSSMSPKVMESCSFSMDTIMANTEENVVNQTAARSAQRIVDDIQNGEELVIYIHGEPQKAHYKLIKQLPG